MIDMKAFKAEMTKKGPAILALMADDHRAIVLTMLAERGGPKRLREILVGIGEIGTNDRKWCEFVRIVRGALGAGPIVGRSPKKRGAK